MLTREGIVHVLAAAGVEVVADVGDVDGLMRAVATQKPDCALVDIRLPLASCVELEERLTKFIVDKLRTFEANPGPRLRPVIAWTLAADTATAPAKLA